MFTYENLDYHYSLSAPVSGGEANLNMFMDYPRDTKVSTYLINDDKINQIIETFSIYETGLVTYVKNIGSTIEVRTNKEFLMQEDGSFRLVG